MAIDNQGASRIKKPSWKDPRLFIGILLVLASVAGVVALVGASNRTVAVWAASKDIGVGESLDSAKLHKVSVDLGDVQGNYLIGSEPLAEGSVAVRSMHENQIISKDSVGGKEAVGFKRVPLKLDTPAPKGVLKGNLVDIWVSPTTGVVTVDAKNAPGPEARKVITNAEIADVSSDSGGLTGGSGSSIYVLVRDQDVSLILNAIAQKSLISIVWGQVG